MAQNDMTPEQQAIKQQLLDEMADYGKHLEELATANFGKYVVAGYAGNSTEPNKLYCFCGEGKGYHGAPIVPANGTAVVFASKADAERKASLLKYSNGYGERITLKAMPASEYFWLVYDYTCKTMQMFENFVPDKQ